MNPVQLIRNGMKSVARILRGNRMTSATELRCLSQLAASVRKGCIVEVGSYRGASTAALAAGAKDDVAVYAVEPHEEFVGLLGGQFGPADRAAFFRRMLRTGHYQSVRLVNLPSHVAAAGWEHPVGLLWIDGDHTYDGVRRDFEAWRVHLTDTTIIAFHDSTDQSLGPYQLIGELTENGEYQVEGSCGSITWGRCCYE